MSPAKARQASRSAPAPPVLLEYIETSNILPAPEKLPGAIEGDPGDYWQDDHDIEFLRSEYPAFRNYLGNLDLERDAVQVLTRCRGLKAVRRVLRAIAQWDRGDLVGRELPQGELADLISVGTGPDGKFKVTYSPLLAALEGIEIFRIRECARPTCRKIFWAGRADQKGCSESCAKALRNQRYRETGYPEKYKSRRIQREEAKDDRRQTLERSEIERKKLRELRAPNNARRSPRLPGQ